MLSAPAADRNKEPILTVLKQILTDNKPLKALEIASGTGQHVAHFASHFRSIEWTPSDVDAHHFPSISAYLSQANLSNVHPPLLIDVTSPVHTWPISGPLDIIYCANMIHISPYPCTIGLFAAAGSLLKPLSGLLITYGPYAEDGVISPDSNVRFDQSLRNQNPLWGIRDINQLIELAKQNGLSLITKVDMPANNKTLVFKRD